MIKDKIRNCLEENIILWQTETNSLPKITFDKYTYKTSNLYVGDPDTEGRIQWQYAPVSRILDFSDLEMENHVVLPQDLKDYYNAYFFLELHGFIDGECISFEPLDEMDDVLENLAYFMSGEEDENFGTVDFIILGIYGHKYPFGISKIGSGQVVAVLEDNEEYVLAESLYELFTRLKIACEL